MKALQNRWFVFCKYNNDMSEHLATKIGNFQKGRDELYNVDAMLYGMAWTCIRSTLCPYQWPVAEQYEYHASFFSVCTFHLMNLIQYIV